MQKRAVHPYNDPAFIHSPWTALTFLRAASAAAWLRACASGQEVAPKTWEYTCVTFRESGGLRGWLAGVCGGVTSANDAEPDELLGIARVGISAASQTVAGDTGDRPADEARQTLVELQAL